MYIISSLIKFPFLEKVWSSLQFMILWVDKSFGEKYITGTIVQKGLVGYEYAGGQYFWRKRIFVIIHRYLKNQS